MMDDPAYAPRIVRAYRFFIGYVAGRLDRHTTMRDAVLLLAAYDNNTRDGFDAAFPADE